MVKSKAEVVQATKNEIQSTWRVYIKEWLHVAFDCTEETLVEQFFKPKYGGRVLDEDWRVTERYEEIDFELQVRLWNVKAEWKHEEEAQEHVRLLSAVGEHPEAEAIPRNSRQEHVLMGYGKLMLKEVKNEEA